MLGAGVNVAFGHDDVMDPWFPMGTGNPLLVANVRALAAQMTSPAQIGEGFAMITTVRPLPCRWVTPTASSPAGPRA